MNIAVTGSSGQLGHLVVENLKGRGLTGSVIALARSPEKAKDLGVEVREADYSRPGTLAAALMGVDRLLLISSSEVGKRIEQHGNVIAAAKAANVRHIIYTSVLGADRSPLSLAAEHRATEALLKDSGLPFTILRNGWYTENYLMAIPGALASGAFTGCAGQGRISSAMRSEYAEAAAQVLASEGHAGKTYELAGDQGWTLANLAAEVSRQTGRDIPYRNLTEAQYASHLEEVGMASEIAKALAGWESDIASGALCNEERQLSSLIGRPTTSLAEAVAQTLR